MTRWAYARAYALGEDAARLLAWRDDLGNRRAGAPVPIFQTTQMASFGFFPSFREALTGYDYIPNWPAKPLPAKDVRFGCEAR